MAKPKLPKLKLGQIVAITFADHSADVDAFTFVTIGIVYSLNRKVVGVTSWTYEGDDYPEIDKNCHVFSILRSAISSIKVLGTYPFEPELVQLPLPLTDSPEVPKDDHPTVQ